MSLKLLIHIGYPKTGTSALQRSFFSSSTALSKAGVLYPKTGLNSSDPGHHGLFSGVSNKADFETSPTRETLQALHHELRTFHGHTAVLSTEDITRLFLNVPESIEQFQQEFSFYDPSLVIFLRRADQYLQSFFFQKLKAFSHGQLKQRLPTLQREIDFITRKSDEHLSMLANLRNHFDKSRLLLHPYSADTDTVEAFCTLTDLQLCLDIPGFITRQSINARYNRELLYLTYLVATHPQWEILQPILVSNRNQLLAYTHSDKTAFTIFSEHDIDLIKERTTPSYKALSNLYDSNLFASDDWTLDTTATPFLSPPIFSEQALQLIEREFTTERFSAKDIFPLFS